MNLNFFSGDALLRTAPLADDADADGPAGENRPAQPEVTYRELLPKLLKSPLPLVLLVGVRYLIEFSVPIALYLGWAVVYNNLNHDFAAHLVFRSTENVWCITREFLRSLLLASVVLLVLGKDVFSSREIFQLLYLCPLSGSVEKRTLTYSLCTAIMLDAVSRTIALSLKIGVNVFVPFIRRNAVLRKCCSNSNGFLRRNLRCIGDFCRDRGRVNDSPGDPAVRGVHTAPGLRRRTEHVNPLELEEARGGSGIRDGHEGTDNLINTEEHDQQALLDFIYIKRLNIFYDCTLHVYRHAIPIQIWINYFSGGPYSTLFTIVYIGIKSVAMLSKVKGLLFAARNFLLQEFEHGKYATDQELSALANCTCSICYDTFQRPIVLTCKHIFCEHCILEWFQREASCPICRKTFRSEFLIDTSVESVSGFPVLI